MIITSDLEYRVTRDKAEMFRTALDQTGAETASCTHPDPGMLQLQREAADCMLARLEEQLTEYEQLKTAAEPVVRVRDFGEIGEGLMAARVAKGWSPQQLAMRTDLTEQEILLHEKDYYTKANFQVLLGVAYALGVQVEMTLTVPREAAPATESAHPPALEGAAPADAPIPKAAEG